MTARAAVYSLLSGDATLALSDYGNVAGQFWGANAVDDPTSRPFGILRWEEETPIAFGADTRRGTRLLTVWAHDEGRDYERINKILERVRTILLAATHVPGADGYTLTVARWEGASGELYDDGYATITRHTDFTVVSRPS